MIVTIKYFVGDNLISTEDASLERADSITQMFLKKGSVNITFDMFHKLLFMIESVQHIFPTPKRYIMEVRLKELKI